MSQVYFSGQFYYAKSATVAGESPSTAAAKWQELAIPADLKASVAMAAAAGILGGAGQHEVASRLRAEADAKLGADIREAVARDGVTRNLAVRN